MIHFQIRHIPEVSSTNTVVLEEARQGAPEGLVITTDYQTAGRGKPGKDWWSPRGKNLLFSILLRPPLRLNQVPLMTQIACRAVAKTLKEKYGIDSEFKRPNDVMAGGQKLCGTLVEALSTPVVLEAVAAGIGLNVNAEASELIPSAVSMAMITGKVYPLKEILEYILEELSERIGEWYKTGTMR